MPNDQDVEMEQEENVGAAATEEGECMLSASAEGDAYVSIRKPETPMRMPSPRIPAFLTQLSHTSTSLAGYVPQQEIWYTFD